MRESSRRLQALMAFLEKNGIHPGDKVAILSTNMPNWGVAYFSITFMGAVAVPILPDFSATEVGNVLEHSGAKAIFISPHHLPRIEGFKSDDLKTAILVEDFSLLFSEKGSSDFDSCHAKPGRNMMFRKKILHQLSTLPEQPAVQKG